MHKVLVVDDDVDLADRLRHHLAFEDVDVHHAADGPAGLEQTRVLRPHLVILDLSLPRLDGFRVLRAIRADGLDVPVLVHSALSDETSVVLGFRLGADAFVGKPCGALELLARIGVLLRRARAAGRDMAACVPERGAHDLGDTMICIGDVEIDTARRRVRRQGVDVRLTPKQFDLLVALTRRGGEVATSRELLAEVWDIDVPLQTRCVGARICELRSRLGGTRAGPELVRTVRGVGYQLAVPDAMPARSGSRPASS